MLYQITYIVDFKYVRRCIIYILIPNSTDHLQTDLGDEIHKILIKVVHQNTQVDLEINNKT